MRINHSPTPRYWFLRSVLCAVAVLFAFAVEGKSAILDFPQSESANIGIVIRDMRNGWMNRYNRYQEKENAAKMLTPASILKCVTAAAVLADGKENDRFNTDFSVTGELLSDGTITGNLIIKPSGDPTICSSSFPQTFGVLDSVAANLKSRGIRAIAGSIVVDSVGFLEPGPGFKWEVEDMRYSYGVGLYPLNYRENATSGDRAMTDPASAFISALTDRLATRDIAVRNQPTMDAPGTRQLVYRHQSPIFKDIMRSMVVHSNNLFAEAMLRSLAPKGYTRDAVDRCMALMDTLGLQGRVMQTFDGSGLSRGNRLTPIFMADLLEAMAKGKYSDQYVSLFPLVGEEGTVKQLLHDTPLQGRLALKSGSMNGVLCYAGYRFGTDGLPTHVVVIMVNQFNCRQAAVREAIGKYLLKKFN